jgi:hypothetical protein
MWSPEERKGMLLRSVHHLDEPTGPSLSMVASLQCRFHFARQNHCSAAASSAANCRMHGHPGIGRSKRPSKLS